MKRMRKPSQEQKVLGYMLEHGSITPLEAIREFGILRLAPRISDLERRGYKIKHRPVNVTTRDGDTTRVMAYSLEDE